MAGKTNFPNGLNQGEGKDSFKEFMEKLNKEGRVELGNFSAELLAKYGTLNLAVTQGKDAVRIRSGGYEVMLRSNNVEVYREKRVEVNGRTYYIIEQEPVHAYVSDCLVKNFKELLFNLLSDYGYEANDKWITVRLPRSDARVRKLQSWILALINGFNRALHDSPLVC